MYKIVFSAKDCNKNLQVWIVPDAKLMLLHTFCNKTIISLYDCKHNCILKKVTATFDKVNPFFSCDKKNSYFILTILRNSLPDDNFNFEMFDYVKFIDIVTTATTCTTKNSSRASLPQFVGSKYNPVTSVYDSVLGRFKSAINTTEMEASLNS